MIVACLLMLPLAAASSPWIIDMQAERVLSAKQMDLSNRSPESVRAVEKLIYDEKVRTMKREADLKKRPFVMPQSLAAQEPPPAPAAVQEEHLSPRSAKLSVEAPRELIPNVSSLPLHTTTGNEPAATNTLVEPDLLHGNSSGNSSGSGSGSVAPQTNFSDVTEAAPVTAAPAETQPSPEELQPETPGNATGASSNRSSNEMISDLLKVTNEGVAQISSMDVSALPADTDFNALFRATHGDANAAKKLEPTLMAKQQQSQLFSSAFNPFVLSKLLDSPKNATDDNKLTEA